MPTQFATPGVFVEEHSVGPRPVTMTGTTETAFVGLVTIPDQFFLGKLRTPDQLQPEWRPLMPLPQPEPSDAIGSWQTALAFLPFTKPKGSKPKRSDTEKATEIKVKLDGKSSSMAEIEDLLKTNSGAKVYVIGGANRAKDARTELSGSRSVILKAMESEGEYEIEPKQGEVRKVVVEEVKVSSSIAAASNGVDGEMLKLADLIKEALGDEWEPRPRETPEFVEVDLVRSATRESSGAQAMQVRFRRSLLAYRELEDIKQKAWVLNSRASKPQLMATLAAEAIANDIPYRGNLTEVVDESRTAQLKMSMLQERMGGEARQIRSVDGFETWVRDFAAELFINLHSLATETNRRQSETIWRQLHPQHQQAWLGWVNCLQGIDRLELGVRGFFTNGGQVADLAVAIQGNGSLVGDKNQFLKGALDSISQLSMIAAPGLDRTWQDAILTYAGATGRKDCFAILETPRYFLTRCEDPERLGKDRWMKGGVGYEQPALEFRASPEDGEQRFPGFASDELLSTVVPRDERGYGAAYGPWLIVENPRASGPHDRFVVAPPSGHVAGMIAATDLSPGGGVHKAPANEVMSGIVGLTTSVSDAEQGPLNLRSINMIRHRPFAGIRCWGARTVASDPLWRYINVRRLFLMVERSVRDAISWAVFLPNTDATRGDLRSTIFSFLVRLHTMGALDGQTPKEAFSVRCDRENNPDSEVREGILTVDISLRPVYPAEFIRLRFMQSPQRSEVIEG